MRKGDHVNAIAQISYRVGNNFLSHLFCKFNGRMILNLLQSEGPKNADLRLSRRHVWNLFLHSMTKTSSLSDFFFFICFEQVSTLGRNCRRHINPAEGCVLRANVLRACNDRQYLRFQKRHCVRGMRAMYPKVFLTMELL